MILIITEYGSIPFEGPTPPPPFSPYGDYNDLNTDRIHYCDGCTSTCTWWPYARHTRAPVVDTNIARGTVAQVTTVQGIVADIHCDRMLPVNFRGSRFIPSRWTSDLCQTQSPARFMALVCQSFWGTA